MGIFSNIGKALFGGGEAETHTFDVDTTMIGSQNEKEQLIAERDAIRNQFEDGRIDGTDAIHQLRTLNIQIADDSVYCLRCRIHHSGPQC